MCSFKLHTFLMLWMACCFAPSMVVAQHEVIKVPVHFGHPDIEVWSVAKDEHQLMYLSTNHGMYRYDGRSLEALKWKMPASRVSCSIIVGDSLISGHESGELSVISRMDGSILSTDTISASAINSIQRSDEGQLIIATAGSGVCVLFADGRRTCFVDDLSDGFVNDLVLLPNNKILASTDRGVDIMDLIGEDSIRYIKPIHHTNDLYTSAISRADSVSSVLVAGLATGVHRVSSNRFDGIVSFGIENVASVRLFSELGRYWALINGQQIFQLVEVDGRWSANLFAELTAPAVSFFGVEEGFLTVWLADGGLRQIPSDYLLIRSITGQSLAGISAICKNPEGGIWLAIGDTLLLMKNRAGVPYSAEQIVLERNSVFPIISLAVVGNHILAGTFGEGLYVYDFVEKRQSAHLNENLEQGNNSVLDIATDGQSAWISTLSGVEKVNLKQSIYTVSLQGSPGYVYCLYWGGRGELLVGSQGASLFRARGDQIIPATDSSGHLSIISMSGDSDSTIWTLSSESELYHFSREELSPHSLNEQLSSLLANRLFEFPGEGVGLISAHAIYHITDETATEVIGGPNLFASDFQNISTTDSKGYLWLARSDGLIMIEPRALQSNYLPETSIQSVRINNEFIGHKNASFSHTDSDIKFRLFSAWHDPYRPVAYEYRLMGQDSLWRPVVQPELNFAQLQPGSYRLEIRTLFGHLMTTVHKTQYAFTILPPFYARWWFITALLLVVALLLLWYVNWRERAIERAMALKSERILTQFEMLKNQINPHFLFNSFNTLASLIPDDPKKAEDFTEKLSGFFREILSAQDHETNTLERELQLAADFIFLQQSRFGESLKYSTEIDPSRLRCQLPTLSLQILLENAVKHNQISPDIPLDVRIFTQGDVLVVSNNLQLRSPKPESTGLGLNNLSNRFEILMGKVPEINGQDGKFNVILPLVKCS